MSSDNSPDKPHDDDATTPDVSRSNVLTVAEAAEILRVSPRSVQRRCQSGKLKAQRVEAEFGEQWQVDRQAVENAVGRATTPQRQVEAPSSDAPTTQRPTGAATSATVAAVGSGNVATSQVERLEKEVDFLRGLVEQHQRAEAELRAALRETLKAMPRELTTGTPQRETAQEESQIVMPDNTAMEVQTSAKSLVNAKSAAPRREPRSIWKLILGIR